MRRSAARLLFVALAAAGAPAAVAQACLKADDKAAVRIAGTLFGQHTAYHIAPILISTRSVEPAR